MSRSYKRTPRCGDQKDRYFKKYSNHKICRLPIDELPKKGKTYKKVLHDYSICDYETVGTSFQQYWARLIKRWHEWEWHYAPYPDYEEAYEEYRRWFLRK